MITLYIFFFQARPIKPLYNVNNNVISPPLSVVAPVSDPSVTSSSSLVHSSVSSLSSEPSTSSVTVISQSVTPTTSALESVAKPIPTTQFSKVNLGNYVSSAATLSAGVQPLITYSVVGTHPKTTTLTVTTNQFLTQNPPLPPVNGHYIYHPNPIMSGAIPIHPSAVYPVLPQKQIIRNDLKPQIPASAILTLSNGLEATTINDKVESKSQTKLGSLVAKVSSTEANKSSDKIIKAENSPPVLTVES